MTDDTSAALGRLEDLKRTAIMLRTWAPEVFPEVGADGQVHFGRAMMESAAEAIEAFLKAGLRFPSGIRALGVGHVGDNPRALIVTLTDPPGDDDIRALHDWLVWRPSALDAEWCINMARQEGDSEIGAGAIASDWHTDSKGDE